MCIRIRVVDVCPRPVAWDPDEQAVIIRRGTHPPTALTETHLILRDLDAPPGPVLLCHCGEPIPLPPLLAGLELTEVPVVTIRAVAHGA
ncbi:hypothetical protein ABH931_006078 [Streptacidiphilus sp. MAP12-33]|uniref:hypothetical protein n=1 Tax=Streptacidiphilus sp. MAP12-33 TaxID=3156266 RepID=UPI0035113C62